MGLFSNSKKGKGSHPFFHKGSKTNSNNFQSGSGSDSPHIPQSMLFIKHYDILTILREILMPHNQN
ncbi:MULTISPECIES: hypothetical protein [unclassified Sphingobacterium]|uniref:hypothetical protein n=1 Tax=unclassified Sphingobacterium TaxID=2609468 RepID=UPI001B53C451|nr:MULTISPECIES: hypothetical protein [unclassified Sphingobacterium]MDR6734633.1 hypothetical protein [Sphingobacterium sp. 2149]